VSSDWASRFYFVGIIASGHLQECFFLLGDFFGGVSGDEVEATDTAARGSRLLLSVEVSAS
jgi:hypothetical protein